MELDTLSNDCLAILFQLMLMRANMSRENTRCLSFSHRVVKHDILAS